MLSPIRRALDLSWFFPLPAVLAMLLYSGWSGVFFKTGHAAIMASFMEAAFLIPFRVIFFSGMYGILVEMVAGETKMITWEGFKKNARCFWAAYLFWAALPFLAYAALFFLHIPQPLTQPLFAGLFMPVVFFAMAQHIL
ncbi:MAG: hypothetical protein HQL19_08290, partial [Candidatus Omnitrophica bacterium]|nr:hypothetical protein [Candidatus Omnitrophota bacterium]